MAVTAYDIHMMNELRKIGQFQGYRRVIELGSQTIPSYHRELVHKFLQPLSRDPLPPAEQITPEIAYRCLGFETYKSIDTDGLRGAMVFDLNKDLRETYGYSEQFDLVTNMGTTEHVFNQAMVFKTIHDLCAVGGMMIHVLPFQGYLNHCFYNYHPLFFHELIQANQYQSLGLLVGFDTRKMEMSPYDESLFKHKPEFAMNELQYTLSMFLKKKLDREFQIPHQGSYPKAGEEADGDAV